MEYYSAVTIKLLTHMTTQMDLRSIMLRMTHF